MRYTRVMVVLGMVLALAGCNKAPKDDMKTQLDKIRSMEIHSTMISVEAACSEPAVRARLVDGALALLRRATAGPEMTRIHQMMGNMNMDKPGNVPAISKQQPESPQQAMHMAVHTAGGDGFDLLDAMTRPPGVSCAQLQPVRMAAAAAALRQHHGPATAQGVERALDNDVDKEAINLDSEVQASITDKTPDVVRTLALALQKI